MGSGSSRSSRALRRLRGPDRQAAGPGGAASEGESGPLAPATREEAPEDAGPAAAGGASGPDPRPTAPPDSRDETLRLLDQLLAESEAWGPGELAPRGSGRPRPPAGAGSPGSPKQSAGVYPDSSSIPGAPGASHARPEKPSGVLYDRSEEELMASIEREYCG